MKAHWVAIKCQDTHNRSKWENPRAGTISHAGTQARTARVAENKICLVRLVVGERWLEVAPRH